MRFLVACGVNSTNSIRLGFGCMSGLGFSSHYGAPLHVYNQPVFAAVTLSYILVACTFTVLRFNSSRFGVEGSAAGQRVWKSGGSSLVKGMLKVMSIRNQSFVHLRLLATTGFRHTLPRNRSPALLLHHYC